ncbi:MAG: phytoene desaturase family protein [Deinococcales bacterium]
MTQVLKPHRARIMREDLHADVTIIGAGFAGLVAGALLTQKGHKVRVLERDIHPGGCAARYERKHALGTFGFAVGATVCAGLEQGGLFYNIFQKLGIQKNLPNLDPVMRLHLNGQQVQVAGTRAGWATELARAFPSQLVQKQKFWREIQSFADTMHHAARRYPSMPWKSLADVWDTAQGIHPGVLKVLLNLNRTVGDLLEKHKINDPAHKAFIDGQLLDSMQCISQQCALPNGAYALEVYRYGAQYVPGGLASLAEDLANYIDRNGSKIHYATRAKGILQEGGKVRGIEAHGRNFISPVVISTAPIHDTLKLVNDRRLASVAKKLEHLPEVWGAFTLYIGVDEKVLPKNLGLFEQIVRFDEHGLTDNFLVSISAPNDSRRAPPGYRSVTISTHVKPQDFFGLSEDAYHEQKQRLEHKILSLLEAHFPGFTGGIVLLESGSPRTFERFTLHSLGRVGGIPQMPHSANFNALHHVSGVPGLFFAGETIFPGQGTLGVAVSGFNSARSSERYLKQHHTHHSMQTVS